MNETIKSAGQIFEEMERDGLLTPASLKARESSWRQGYWKGYLAALEAFHAALDQSGLAAATYDHLYEFHRTTMREWAMGEPTALEIEPPPNAEHMQEAAD